MKKSNQEISVLHIEFPLHTILIIGGTILEIDWHISHFTKSEIVNIISMANFSVRWNEF